ncbi:zinc-dependent alcohol dehydrogenase [Halopelagius longus]|uniref:Glutathione-dependent formaldehyde dehydrogenase n=1 Tax=Halopelagius longus TaxID=1236180 RepID=A0A1H0XX62_9EURY|nr:zinc-dependent alcohol dehydrogenase [Halopelagius longus]RDI72150.1 glutathione-dependent formaldehyde dehydrogenase [Halopelagius longus]SDQ07504.1 Threonine dehydrogenase [Halopelagius longus]
MRALCWNGVNDLGVETVPDPELVNPRDVVLRVTLTTACGSDLHFIDGYLPSMREGDVIGHEFMGEVAQVGRKVEGLEEGDRVVVPSFVGCGSCAYCQDDLWSLCDNTNPNPELQEPILGDATAGIYGYTHAFGGYAGSHAEYVRVPHAEENCFHVPDELSDEQALFASDAWPTGYMGADFCDIEPGDIVAVWGCGGVGLMAQHSARLMGAERVIGIDRFPERLRTARKEAGSETIDYTAVDSVVETLHEMTGGRGPDACIDAVGMEAHGTGVAHAYDRAKQQLKLHTDRGDALRQAIRACRKGGTLSILGVYGVMDKFPMGVVMNKGLTVRTAQQHGQRYVPELLEHVEEGEMDPSYLATHEFSLEDSPRGYEMFKEKEDGCIRPVFTP